MYWNERPLSLRTFWKASWQLPLLEYVERIPDPEGQVMKLYLTGLDAEAIADNMQLSIRTVYNVKSRAVGMLKKFFSLSNE